nr:uncharacterized protein LOC113392580 [Vanessa tameamea]
MIFVHDITVFVMLVLYKGSVIVLASSSDWETIEALAEEHPYVVAVLNQAKDYVCSGTVINKMTVLTSGGCINPVPHYVVVGTAVFSNNINNNSIFQVSFSKLHADFILDIQEENLNIKQMHSNIGLIFTIRPFLDYYLESAVIGNYYASELKDKKLRMVGFGQIGASEALVLQQQAYHQMACKNPKWYYCICGIEYSAITYEEPFGEGAPVLYNNVVVGVAASTTGSLVLNRNINYNIFTVIGPYLQWIEKSKWNSIIELKEKRNNSVKQTGSENHLLVILANVILNKLVI